LASAGDIRAGRAFVELGVEGLEAVKAKLSGLGNAIQALGTSLALGFAVNKVTGWVSAFADGAREIFLMSRQLQMTTDEYQEMTKAARELGIETESMTMAINKSRQYVAELAVTGQDTNATMRELGLTLGDVANLSDLDRIQLFGERLRALGNREMTARIGRQIFGRGGVPIAAVAGDLGAARENARGGFSLTEDQIKQGYELSQASRSFERSLGGVGKVIGSILAPGFTTVYKTLTDIVKAATGWIADNKEIVRQIAVAGGIVVGLSTALIAVASISSVIGFAWGGITTIFGAAFGLVSAIAGIIGAIVSPIGLIVAGAAALGYFLLRDSQVLGQIGAAFASIGEIASQTLGGIADALAGGDIGAAWDVLIAGMKVAWYQFNEVLKEKLGVDLIEAFFSIRTAWVETVAFMRTAWVTAVNAMQSIGENMGTSVSNWFLRTWGEAMGYSQDVINATISQNNNAQRASDANRERDRQQALTEIEAQRRAGREGIAADRANRDQDRENAQIELDNALEAANIAAAQAAARRQAMVGGAQRGLDEFADRKNVAAGTFSTAALFGFGGNSPLARLENIGQRQVAQLEAINANLENLDEARLS